MKSPQFSIIIVSLNSEKTIGVAIESILSQGFTDYEIIFVDGASSDDTINIIKGETACVSDKVTIVSEKDDGMYYAMNKGIGLARAPWISFLNSDDWFGENTLSVVADAIKKNGDVDILYGLITIWGEVKILTMVRSWENLMNESISHPGTFFSRSLFEKLGSYDTKYKLCADYEYFLRANNAKARVTQIDSVLANFRMGGMSTKRAYIGEKEKVIIQAKYRHDSWINTQMRLFRAWLANVFRNVGLIVRSVSHWIQRIWRRS
jgi:glycosyltransferase involved in cell wall biosynthesis